ncbi:hypothetical protein SSUA7_0632 [Streptococcus suis A7]|uniref:Uncharacterized protein n=2 Tax=Streptococcus suis TaxID=1307 RepID=D5AH12_STRGZ|nr:hypothetical protein SSU98_0679 [Streptococcus suis 98HAH33]ADE31127.1 hypothetical protein SSGZ1_0668 [Streptococcus suis GZ1]ADV69854.1 hypothetical protein SSUJS14_0767 [Streptococcus suis JS14]AER14825.1 hypothetical protein SSU12_0634 [Streptococcus suis SS12]AER43960.1 hypothetical protein SSUA7_0632 [Streptococcus suis A7]
MLIVSGIDMRFLKQYFSKIELVQLLGSGKELNLSKRVRQQFFVLSC